MPFLHTIRGTADVDVDFVVAFGLGHRRALSQGSRVIAPQLHSDRMLAWVKVEQVILLAIKKGAGRNHFGE